MEKANIRLAWNCERVDPSGLKAHYLAAGFALPGHAGGDDVAKLLAPGTVGVFAFCGNTAIGMAQAFSDTLTTTWLAELCVDPDWQGRGIDRLLTGVQI